MIGTAVPVDILEAKIAYLRTRNKHYTLGMRKGWKTEASLSLMKWALFLYQIFVSCL